MLHFQIYQVYITFLFYILLLQCNGLSDRPDSCTLYLLNWKIDAELTFT